MAGVADACWQESLSCLTSFLTPIEQRMSSVIFLSARRVFTNRDGDRRRWQQQHQEDVRDECDCVQMQVS